MNSETLLINKYDFDCIGQVAKHCDWDQLCIYIREQQNLSLLPKIGQCLYDLVSRYVEGKCDTEENKVLQSLWHGGRYEACDGQSKVHFGLKRSLVHWAYGAYMFRHSFVDTPFGVVQKVNQDSVPVDIKTLNAINKEQRSNAEYYYGLTMEYLCSVKGTSPIIDCKVCDCVKGCGCNHCKGKGATQQRRGARFKNITKY